MNSPQSVPARRCDLLVAEDHPAFPGHFPDFPLLPGACLLDLALREIVRARGLDLLHWRLASAKFLRIVRPGSVLTLEHSASDESSVRFTVLAGTTAVASGLLSAIAVAPVEHHGA